MVEAEGEGKAQRQRDNMAHTVFISKADADELLATVLCKALECRGVKCWIAPRDIKPGLDFRKAIAGAIDECSLIVLVFSSHANDSAYVTRELTLADERHVPIIVFRTEDVRPTNGTRFILEGIQWIDAFTRPLEVHIQSLVETVEWHLHHMEAA
jgi:hypothetical protein